MPRGYPDFFGQQQFPSYGQLIEIDEEDTSIAVDSEELIYNISAKGRIYSARILLDCLNTYNDSFIRVAIDGYYAAYVGINQLLFEGNYAGDSYPLYITCYRYNGTKYYATLGLRDGLTFGYSFQVSIINNELNVIGVSAQLIYARVI
jgi:hypothetical protein